MSEEKLAQVFHFDLYGKREDKYDFLNENSVNTIDWNTLEPKAPNHFFVKKDFEVQEIYDEGFSVNSLFHTNSVGIVTSKDAILVNGNKEILTKNVQEYYSIEINNKVIQKVAYRPFDEKYIYFDTKLVERSREKLMKNFINKENVAIDFCRQLVSDSYYHIFITNKMVDDSFVSNKSRERGYVCPLYLYPESNSQQNLHETPERVPKLNMEMVQKFADGLGLYFAPEKPDYNIQTEETNQFYPIDILDYIYAVLHSPTYRETYKEFLKIDFPRVPYPSPPTPDGGVTEAQAKFWELVELGGHLRQLHLLESETVENYITQYPEDGDNIVGKPKFITSVQLNSPPLEGCPPSADGVVGKVYINYTQYFNNVPEIAWNFYIGGYQPAQKWLKDRKDRELSFEDILHYQKMIVALFETDRIMKEIDKIMI